MQLELIVMVMMGFDDDYPDLAPKVMYALSSMSSSSET